MSQTPPAIPPSASPPPDMPGGKKKTLRIVIAVIITCAAISSLALLVSAFLPGLDDAKEQARELVNEQVKRQAKEQAREQAKKEQEKQFACAANLRAIGKAIHIYSSNNDDWCPSDLKKIYPYIGGTFTQQRCPLRCPSAGNNRDCDYFYRRPAASRMSRIEADLSKVIIACDFKDNHDGKGRSVLFADGHAQWMSEEQFQQKLQQPHNTAFAKALREAEGQ